MKKNATTKTQVKKTNNHKPAGRYVDGFVIPVNKRKMGEYKLLAQTAGKIWMDHGALEYRECVGEDLQKMWGIPFAKLSNIKSGETVVFSWIVYKSRAHRDKVNAAVMADPRMKAMMDSSTKSFDCKRMTYGGFDIIVNL